MWQAPQSLVVDGDTTLIFNVVSPRSLRNVAYVDGDYHLHY